MRELAESFMISFLAKLENPLFVFNFLLLSFIFHVSHLMHSTSVRRVQRRPEKLKQTPNSVTKQKEAKQWTKAITTAVKSSLFCSCSLINGILYKTMGCGGSRWDQGLRTRRKEGTGWDLPGQRTIMCVFEKENVEGRAGL